MKKLFAASLLAMVSLPAFAFACGNTACPTQPTDTNSCGQSTQCGTPAPTPAPSCDQTPQCGSGTPAVDNTQGQYGNIYARVNAYGYDVYGTQLSGSAVGNNFSAKSEAQDLNVYSTQRMYGNVGSKNNVLINNAHGLTTSINTAQGNTSQAIVANNTLYNEVQQYTHTGTKVKANTNITVNGADTIVSSVQGAGNNWAVSADHALVQSYSGQYNNSGVSARSYVNADFNTGSINSSAIAAGNTHTITGSASTVYSVIDQGNSGNVRADAIVLNGYANNNVAAATATGNNANITNDWGFAQLGGYQENNGSVSSRSLVLNEEFSGTAVSGATAMGNSGLVSNIGSDARLDLAQNNYGAVNATANFVGSSSTGGVGMANAFASGNSLTGFACAGCGGGNVSMQGNSSQYNYAPVTATANINVGGAGMIIGSATAVGNSASYIAQGAR